MTNHRYPSEQFKLLAFYYSTGDKQWTPLAGEVRSPALVYEVIRTTESGERTIYEGRIFDAATRRMIHNYPYTSPLPEDLGRWFSRETETDPPEELLSCRENTRDERKDR